MTDYISYVTYYIFRWCSHTRPQVLQPAAKQQQQQQQHQEEEEEEVQAVRVQMDDHLSAELRAYIACSLAHLVP